MKKIILFIFIIALIPLVSAQEKDVDIYRLNEVFDLSIHLSDESGDITGANCQTQIRRANFTVKDEFTNTEVEGGWYNGTYNSSEPGIFLCRHNCTKGTDFTSGTCDFKIEDNLKVILAVIITILVIAFILLIVGIWQQDWNFIFSSGFVFSVIAIYIFKNGFPSFNNWVSNSVALVLIGFGAYLLFRASVQTLNESEE